MKKQRIMVILGTRPEAIKMYPIIAELKRHTEVETIICATGQHRELLTQILNEFDLAPDYNFDIMRSEQSLTSLTGSLINHVTQTIVKERPTVVLVHGDTTTAFASALACFYQGVKVGHVEAGYRTYDLSNPFPEEFNRRAIALICQYHFATNEEAKENLLSEHVDEDSIFITGNTIVDTLLDSIDNNFWHEELDWVGANKLLIITTHRRENLGKPMEDIFHALNELTEMHSDLRVLFPVHPNPIIRKLAKNIIDKNLNIHMVDAMDCKTFRNLLYRSFLVLTDSGGVQEEAIALGKPVLVMRDKSERMAHRSNALNKTIGTDKHSIVEACNEVLIHTINSECMGNFCEEYGDGYASKRIVEILLNSLRHEK